MQPRHMFERKQTALLNPSYASKTCEFVTFKRHSFPRMYEELKVENNKPVVVHEIQRAGQVRIPMHALYGQ